jgi:hypothetical protein
MIERLYIGLVHHPVYNKNHEIVTTAITNLDIHDIARSCKTYGVARFFIINPLDSQKEIFMSLKKFWKSDIAKKYNVDRFNVFEEISFVDDIENAKKEIEKECNYPPMVISTSAKRFPRALNFREIQPIIKKSFPKLILFGTGYGLAENVINQSNFHLEPIKGAREYNHLSVRSAVAVILDRLVNGFYLRD